MNATAPEAAAAPTNGKKTGRKGSAKKKSTKKAAKAVRRAGANGGSLAEFDSGLTSLMQQVEQLRNDRTAFLKGEQARLQGAISELTTNYNNDLKALQAELSPIEAQLGVLPSNLSFGFGGNNSAGGSKAASKPSGKSLNTAMPQGLIDPDGNPITEQFWKQLTAWPFKGDARPKSLGQYITMALYNAGGTAITSPVTRAVIEAMGQNTSAATFNTAMSAAYKKLKEEGFAKPTGQKGCYTLDGRKGTAVERMIAELNEAAAGDNSTTTTAAAAAPAKQKRGPGRKAAVQAPAAKPASGSLEDHILVALKANGGKLQTIQLAPALMQTGYQAKPTDDESTMRAAVEKLKNEQVVVVNIEGNKSFLEVTAQGQQRLAQVA